MPRKLKISKKAMETLKKKRKVIAKRKPVKKKTIIIKRPQKLA